MSMRARIGHHDATLITLRPSFSFRSSSIQIGSRGWLDVPRPHQGGLSSRRVRETASNRHHARGPSSSDTSRLTFIYVGGCLEPKTGTQIAIAWAPFLVLIAFWITFVLYLRISPAIGQSTCMVQPNLASSATQRRVA